MRLRLFPDAAWHPRTAVQDVAWRWGVAAQSAPLYVFNFLIEQPVPVIPLVRFVA